MNCSTAVFFAAIPSKECGTVASPARRQVLDETANPALRRQRYFVWKLLEYALQQYGLDASDLSFHKDENGKWHCAACCFSLSHCENAVAVAISPHPVGVDIEPLSRPLSEAVLARVLTEAEWTAYIATPTDERQRFAVEHWCAKESLFKAGNARVFRPEALAADQTVQTGCVLLNGVEYGWAVTAADIASLQVFDNIAL